MSELGFIAVSFFSFLGLVCSVVTGVFSLVNSVSTGTPIDVWGIVGMFAIAIPCGIWCGWLLYETSR